MRALKTGDPCPCCGQPIRLTNPDALRLLGQMADLLGLPEGFMKRGAKNEQEFDME